MRAMRVAIAGMLIFGMASATVFGHHSAAARGVKGCAGRRNGICARGGAENQIVMIVKKIPRRRTHGRTPHIPESRAHGLQIARRQHVRR